MSTVSCRQSIGTVLGLSLLLLPTLPSLAQNTTASFTVPGTSDPWLAGMPNGSTASGGDVAPDQSPLQVVGFNFAQGGVFTFSAAGTVGYSDGVSDPPDGSFGVSHGGGAENGISDISVPADALVGVFLGPSQPDLSAAPGMLDFSTASSQDYSSLSPDLKQVFFIGDGMTSGGQTQQIIAPANATRLFLGTMDGSGWYNNPGSFSVQVTGPAPVPEASTTVSFGLLVVGLGAIMLKARKRKANAA